MTVKASSYMYLFHNFQFSADETNRVPTSGTETNWYSNYIWGFSLARLFLLRIKKRQTLRINAFENNERRNGLLA